MKVLITGANQGLGKLAAQKLLAGGHQVVAHIRNDSREAVAPEVVVGDLSDSEQVRSIAAQVVALGGVDAIIHNAGLGPDAGPQLLPVNVVAPYLLSCLLPDVTRSVFISSGMHRGGTVNLAALDWAGDTVTATYSDTKLLLTTFAAALAKIRPEAYINSVDPGWVPTRMGGAHASGDLHKGAETQVWLAASTDPAALTTGGYWYHKSQQEPHPITSDETFQNQLIAALAAHTKVAL